MIHVLRLLFPLIIGGALAAGCLEADPLAQQRAEEERRYVESRLETMEAELRESLTNLPAERIMELIGPEVMARQARVAHFEARSILMEELRAELTVELDLRCEELCAAGLLVARRRDRAEAEADLGRALDELRKTRKELDEERAVLDAARSAFSEERDALVAACSGNPARVSCSETGDAAFQQGLFGDAIGAYRAAIKAGGPPECHRVLSRIYGALGYRKNQAKHLKDYLHLMRPNLDKQQVAILLAELRAAGL